MVPTPSAPSPGLCASCTWVKKIESARGSVFWLCGKHDEDPSWPKYPRLPVLRCGAFQPRTGG